MNKQIKELIKAAGGIGHDDDGNELTPMLVGGGLEKFAELIVKRMIDNVECHADLYESPDIKFICEKIVNSIKFDFGVEE